MPLNEAHVREFEFPVVPVTVTARAAILYGLGLGLGSEPVDPRHLRHVYEKDLMVFPTMPLVLGSPGNWFEKAGLDFRKLVHGGQSLTIDRPVPLDTPLQATSQVVGLWDRGAEKGAVADVLRVLSDSAGVPVARLVSRYALRGDGGFGGTPPERSDWSLPERSADAEIVLPILPQAALIYRLNGDTNPLHADPERARAVGFDRPILHGLCTFGMAARAVIEAFVPDDPGDLKDISGRFSRPVYPGETLRVRLWREGGDVWFEAGVDERDTVVFTEGRAVFR